MQFPTNTRRIGIPKRKNRNWVRRWPRSSPTLCHGNPRSWSSIIKRIQLIIPSSRKQRQRCMIKNGCLRAAANLSTNPCLENAVFSFIVYKLIIPPDTHRVRILKREKNPLQHSHISSFQDFRPPCWIRAFRRRRWSWNIGEFHEPLRTPVHKSTAAGTAATVARVFGVNPCKSRNEIWRVATVYRVLNPRSRKPRPPHATPSFCNLSSPIASSLSRLAFNRSKDVIKGRAFYPAPRH